MNAEQVHATVIAMLSAETGCEPSQLTDDDVHIVRRKPENLKLAEHRKFNPHPGRISVVSLGTGAVVSIDQEDFDQAEKSFRGISRDELFHAHRLSPLVEAASERGLTTYGPFPRFTGAASSLRRINTPLSYSVKVIDIEAEDAATGHMINRPEFPNALFPEPGASGRPTVLAAVAYRHDDIAGIAGVSKDSDFMYQIGIDILPEHRGKGLAPALTSSAARAVFDLGALPYYGTSNSNIASMRTALTVGFRPTWIEVLTRPA